MIWIDYAIIGVIALSTLVSLVRGGVREFFSLIAWIGALLLAVAFAASVSPSIESFVSDSCMRVFVAFAIVFAVGFIGIGIFNLVLINVLIRPKGGIIDRIVGVIFGAARGVLMVVVVLLMLDVLGLTDADKDRNKIEEWWPGSQLMASEWFDPYNDDSITSIVRELVQKVVDEEIQGGVCEAKVQS